MKMSVNWELMAHVDENHNVLAGMMRGRAVSEINKNDIVRQINVHNELKKPGAGFAETTAWALSIVKTKRLPESLINTNIVTYAQYICLL